MKHCDRKTKAEFEKECECNNAPETDEAHSCLFCVNRITIEVTNDGMPIEYRHCCSKFKFELCAMTSPYHRCDDFEKRY